MAAAKGGATSMAMVLISVGLYIAMQFVPACGELVTVLT